MLEVLQLLLSALPDNTRRWSSIFLLHPGFHTQNFLVYKDDIITRIIDCDGAYVGAHQGAAAAYPSQLTID